MHFPISNVLVHLELKSRSLGVILVGFQIDNCRFQNALNFVNFQVPTRYEAYYSIYSKDIISHKVIDRAQKNRLNINFQSEGDK